MIFGDLIFMIFDDILPEMVSEILWFWCNPEYLRAPL